MRSFGVCCVAFVLSACGALGGGDPDAGSGPQACTDLVNSTEAIPEVRGIVSFGATGGTIKDGTYHLTKFTIFPPGPVDPNVRRHALRITGDRIEVVTRHNDEPERRMTATMTVVDKSVTFDIDCPQPESFTWEFHAFDDKFTHIVKGEGIHEEHEYTLQ